MKILVLNNNILAVDPVDAGDVWQTSDAIYPKHVVEGAAIIEVDALPDDYAPGRYTFDGSFVRIPDPVITPPVPEIVSMRKARRALLTAGLLDDVEASIAAASREVQIDWEFATEVRRDYPILKEIQSVQGLTDAQVDDLFRLAATFPD